MGNVIERYKKMKDEEENEQRALAESEQKVLIESKQRELWEKEKDRISSWYNAGDVELDKLTEEYATDDKLSEYLVDGAVLRCTGASTEEVCGITLNIDQGADSAGARVRTILNVSENPMSVNGLIYATVRDTVQNKNVVPFRCNCSLVTGGDAESEKIKADKSCNQEGICKHFMSLSDEWDNIPLEGNRYLMMSDINAKEVKGGIAGILGGLPVEGITMTSILFCKMGGLIYPEKSGQDEEKKAMDILRTYLKEGRFDEDELELALQLLASRSMVGLPQYSSKKDKDYNKYDDYILGWCVYYNEEMGVNIDPDYIKSMMYQESKMGYDSSNPVPTTNVKRDVMQALDIKNTNIYNYIGIKISDFEAKTSDGMFQTGRWIWNKNEEFGTPGSPKKERQDRCGAIVRSLFNSEKDGSGHSYTEGSSEMYYLMLDRVTPIMSIGIAMDHFCELFQDSDGDYKNALRKYNIGDPEYARKVIERVNMGNSFVGD